MANDRLQVLNELDGLSEQERQYALAILKEIQQTGSSKKYDELLYSEYREIPVDIDTFLRDPSYLGRGLTNEEGKFTVFPYWVQTLKKIFPNNLDTAYRTVILSGAIGLGKSFVAVICLLYCLYRMMCLKNPYTHYGLQPIDHITFSFINITMDAAKGVAWQKCQELVQLSPWFMSHGVVSKSLTPEWRPDPQSGIELKYGSQPRHILGRAIFASFEDEVSFQIGEDIEKQKEKAKRLISTVDARMQSRFMKGEKLPTLHLIASSKRTEQSFLETYINTKKKNESKTTLIIDEPQWVIRTDKDSTKKFYVAVGNKFLESEVVPLNATEDDLDAYRLRGFQLLQVPMGYYENFVDDLDIALTDIAGISTSNSMHYISGVRWGEVITDSYLNPFTKEIIEVGDGKDDTAQYENYFDLSRIPADLKYKPLYIHLDMSISGDKSGIGGTWIVGKKHSEGTDQSKDLFYQVAFCTSIKAPKGHQISFEKNRNFIRFLKKQGFNIKCVSCDTFQSYDLLQQLKAEGFTTEIISVDRVQDKICRPYQNLKSTIYESRIRCFKHKLLTDEIIGLVRYENGKVDHTEQGINSKDAADAVCGSVYSASQHAEEFAYDYGETMNSFVDANSEENGLLKEQLTVEFEDTLKNFFARKPIPSDQVEKQQQKQQDTVNLDFGFGPATNLDFMNIQDGILVW